MLIREFLCVLEHGLMLFHVGHPHQESKTDNFLRSSLISALYSFASQVENDSIDALRMGKVILMFKKQRKLIFILTLDSSVDPTWCEEELNDLLRVFFQRFPETQWEKETVLDLRTFDVFKTVVTQRLRTLNKRVELLKLLVDERLITKDKYPHHGFDCLGAVVAGRVLQKYHNNLVEAINRKIPTLPIVDKLIDWLEGSHITRTDTTYILNCNTCALCHAAPDCFFETFLETILPQLGYKMHVVIPQHSAMKYLHLEIIT